MFCRDKEPRRWPPLYIVMIITPALREDRGLFSQTLRPKDISFHRFLRFRFFQDKVLIV